MKYYRIPKIYSSYCVETRQAGVTVKKNSPEEFFFLLIILTWSACALAAEPINQLINQSINQFMTHLILKNMRNYGIKHTKDKLL